MGRHKKLLDEVNHHGYLLEYQAGKILFDLSGTCSMRYNWLVNGPSGEEAEIDLIYQRKKYICIIECKKTKNSWFFGREKFDVNNFNYLKTENKEFIPNVNHKLGVFKPFFQASEENGELCVINKKGNTSVSQQKMDSVLRQLTKNTDSFLFSNKEDLPPYLVQIVITNGKLWGFEFDKTKIDKNGDLNDFDKLEEHIFLITNHQQKLFLGPQTLLSKHSYASFYISTMWVRIDALGKLIRFLDGFF